MENSANGLKNNEVMRFVVWGSSFATEVVLLRKLGGNEASLKA
jgi:hypothetical protein